MPWENSVRTIYVLIAVLALSAVLLGVSPVYASMQGDVDQAATIIERFQAVPEKAIPQAVLRDARGLAIMTVIKAGFGLSGRGGSGGGRGATKSCRARAGTLWTRWGAFL